MADIELTFSWLGMTQYLERFLEAGFDSWETVLEVTENDLEILNVDLGSRRKLQREIANTKRLAQDPAFVQPLYKFAPQVLQQQQPQQQVQQPLLGPVSTDGPTKRGYKHHPKPDKDVPERPYSAYVLFSNHTREILKAQSLTFTDLSKTVGERWQALSSGEREAWKQTAAGPWEEYKKKVDDYQKTDKYKAYQRYTQEFKAAQESKKPATKQNMAQPRNMPTETPSELSKVPFPSMSPGLQRTSDWQGSRIAIKKLKREEEIWGEGETTRPPRIRQACEPCRRKKMKCHGERPTCRQCKDSSTECRYDRERQNARKSEEIENLWHKVKAYEALLLRVVPYIDNEDQQAIQDALQMPPQLEGAGDTDKLFAKSGHLGEDESDRHGEDSVEGIGSMGSTDQVNENNFVRQGKNPQDTTAFAGQASDTRWLQKVERELSGDSDQGASNQKKSQLQSEDKDMSLVGGQLYPFELPLRETADALVNAYFNSVHLSFPILHQQQFMTQYQELYNTPDPPSFGDHTFVAIVYLVFAIGAVHAHLVGAYWAGDSRDHILYFANSRVLAVDSGVLNDSCYLKQVQVFGLGTMYLLVTDQINRAWNLMALAVRSAQSIGLHLRNVTPGIDTATQTFFANVWFAIISLEGMITVMTGRPSMINERDCTVSLVKNRQDEDQSSSMTTLSEDSYQTSAPSHKTRTSSSTAWSAALDLGSRQQDIRPTVDVFFKNYTDLCILAKEVVRELYHPGIREKKWSEVQTIIENYDRRLLRWRDALNPPLNVATPSSKPTIESCRVALRILFHSTRTIICRPCLCRLNRSIKDQSRASKRTNHEFVSNCVKSARSVLDLILHKPESTVLHRGTLWWMILHHLRRAITVLLLELSFRAEHMPSEAGELVIEAKAAVSWLRQMGSSNASAQDSWVTLSLLLYQAAQKVGGDTADIFSAPDVPAKGQEFNMDALGGGLGFDPAAGPGRPSSAFDANDPNIFQPMGLHGGIPQGTGQYLGELGAMNDWDEYGFINAWDEMGTLFNQQQGPGFPQDDQQMDL